MRIAYYRVSTGDQSIEAQRTALGGDFGKEFSDVGVSGGVMAAERPGFGKLLEHNLALLAGVARIGEPSLPIVVGVSRKSLVGIITGRPPADRLAGSVAFAALAVAREGSEIALFLAGPRDETLLATLSLRYEPWRNMALHARYRFRTRESEIDGKLTDHFLSAMLELAL